MCPCRTFSGAGFRVLFFLVIVRERLADTYSQSPRACSPSSVTTLRPLQSWKHVALSDMDSG